MSSLEGPPRVDVSTHELGRMERDMNFWGIMNSLRVSGRLCDILLSVTRNDGSDVEYPAHKVILAASSCYFATNMDVLSTLTMHKLDISELGLKAVLDIIYRQDIPRVITESNEVKDALGKLKIFLPCCNTSDKYGQEHQMPFLAELTLGLLQPYGGHHLDLQAQRNRDLFQDAHEDHLEHSKVEAQCWDSLPQTQLSQLSVVAQISESLKSSSAKNYLSLEPYYKPAKEHPNLPENLPEKPPSNNNPEIKETKPAESSDVNPDKYRITRTGTIRKQDIEGSSTGSRRKETCQMCGKVYSHCNILRHIWKVHQCGEKTTSRKTLRPKKLTNGSKYSVSCDICEKKFVRMYSLQMHVGIQHGIKFNKYRELQKVNKLPKHPSNHSTAGAKGGAKRLEHMAITKLPPKRRRLGYNQQRMYHSHPGPSRQMSNTASTQSNVLHQTSSILAQLPQGSKAQEQATFWNMPHPGEYTQQQFQNILGQTSPLGLWQAPPQITPANRNVSKSQEEISLNTSSRVKCHICEETFSTRGSCTRHIARIHDNHRKYSCTFCGKKCFDTTDLKLHTQTHTGEKAHECVHCLKRFIQKGQLRLHIQSVHNEEKQRDKVKHMIDPNAAETFYCKHCDFKSKYKAYLKTHMTRKHCNDTPEITCTQCSKTFKIRRDLIKHVNRVHLQVKRFECEACSRKFYDRRDLDKHACKGNGT